MSEPLPITTPPRRRLDPHTALPHVFMNTHTSSSSCKNTPNVTRKLEPYHHALLDSGTQSAKSSPLPHRRLDKLEGVIRDKPSPMGQRRRFDLDDPASSNESSPAVLRKFPNISGCSSCNHHQDTQQQPTLPNRHGQSELKSPPRRNTTDCGCTSKNQQDLINSPIMRRRVDSDCSCATRSKSNFCESNMTNKSECSPQMHRKNIFSSPAKSVLGEPGCFSSPIHHRLNEHNMAGFGSPAKSVIGEPGVFASPARSVCVSPSDDIIETDPLDPILSGWFKFRDNKRVSYFFFIHYLNNYAFNL